MSLTFGFYNSINGDRTYDAIQMSQIFDGIITDGVYATFMKGMVVKASSNASEVIVQPGRCWFNHTWTFIDADYPVEAPAPEVILDRVDALVLDINQENAWRENKLVWVQGTPSSLNPARPTLENTTTHHQYALCYVYRKAGTTMIYQADITNVIGTSQTPFVTGVLEGIDLDAWINQWDDEFHRWENTTKTQFEGWMVSQQAIYNTWYNSIKDQMDGDLDEFEAWFETIRGIIDEEAATHLQAEIDELAEMLPAGSHIDITTTEPTLYNRNVTVSDGLHPKTVQFDAYGNATVESYSYIGMLTVTSTDGERIATENITVPYFGRYATTLSFWSATVNLVGDEYAAGVIVSVYDSESAIPLTSITLDSQGRGTYIATYPDTYKFRYTYGGQTMEVSLAVTQETTYTVEIHAGFNYQAWLTAGRVSGTYSSLDDVLADEEALRQLMLVHDSVDFLAAANVNADVTKIFNCDLAAKWINLSDYALDTFYAVPAIKTVMDTADKYGYGEWALMPQVPTMTSNTAPYGQCGGDDHFGTQDYYYAFNDNVSAGNWCGPSGTTGTWKIWYKFPNNVKVKCVKFYTDNAERFGQTQIIGGNSESDYTPLKTVSSVVNGWNTVYLDDNTDSMPFYGISVTLINRVTFFAIQFYAWAPKGNVPVMTSDTAPYDHVYTTSSYSTNYGYQAFDGNESTAWFGNNVCAQGQSASGEITVSLVNPIIIKRLYFNHASTTATTQLIVKGRNGDEAATVIKTFTNPSPGYLDLSENTSIYQIITVSLTQTNNATASAALPALTSCQFYGRELSVSVPVMTSNTTPYGEAIRNSVYNNIPAYEAWKAFAPGASDQYSANRPGPGEYVGYKATKPFVLKEVYHKAFSTAERFNSYKIQGSNTGTSDDWHDLSDVITTSASEVKVTYLSNNTTPYLYHRIYQTVAAVTSGNVNIPAGGLQFYGFDYSEKEFEVGATRKWLYDHGLELEPMTIYTSGTGQVTKEINNVYEYAGNTSTGAGNVASYRSTSKIDLTPYSVVRAKHTDFLGQAHIVVLSTDTMTYDGTTWVAYKEFHGDCPNTEGLSVSNLNDNYYLYFACGYGGGRYIRFKEMWLE